MRSLGKIGLSIQTLMASAALPHSLIFAGDVAGVEEEPGSENPMLSMAVDMVLAVYIPPQAPAPRFVSIDALWLLKESLSTGTCVCFDVGYDFFFCLRLVIGVG